MRPGDITENDAAIERHLEAIVRITAAKSIHLLVNDGSSVAAYGATLQGTYPNEHLKALNLAAQVAFKKEHKALSQKQD